KCGDGDVVQQCHVWEYFRTLEHTGNATLIDFVRWFADQRLAIKRYVAFVRSQRPDQLIQEGALAGAVRPDDAVYRVFRHRHADVVGSGQATKALDQDRKSTRLTSSHVS